MRRPLPLNAIRAFEAATRCRSFAAAASELGVSPAAVSHHIRTLEARLGVALFRRSGRGIAPTEPGLRFARIVGDAFAAIDTGLAALAEEAGEARLRLDVDPSFVARWLMPRLGAFRQAHPAIVIEVEAAAGPPRADGGFDLAIRYGAPSWPGFEAEPLVRPNAFPVCAPSVAFHLSAPSDLGTQTLLHDDSPGLWAAWLDLAGVGALDATVLRFSDLSHALDAAAMGLGVALGDDVTCAAELAQGRLVRPFPQSVPSDWFQLLMPAGRRLSTAAGTFRAWLLAEMPEPP
ncbi:LysR family transcriptional regulator [Inquilinus limosus]|uniref:LysR substrate-binding domain-containing protein n=1 Tax=Inquilinus limosus TaxID=171674 RepID=UPI003F16C907